MKNRSIQKKSSKITSCKLLKKNLRMMIINKSLYGSTVTLRLTKLTPFRNLVNVTLQECRFNFLSKEFSTLHHLQELTSFKNLVVNTTQSAWEGLEQAPIITSNLELSKIRNDNLPESLLHIVYMDNFTKVDIYWSINRSSPKQFLDSSYLSLDLPYNNLGRSEQFKWEWLMPAHIGDNLRILDISYNYLTKLPVQITLLTNLQLLNISKNKIDFLPKELGTLPHLKFLNLNSNYLGNESSYHTHKWEWLEQDAIRNKLSQLYLCDNLLTYLPPQIGKLKALTILKLIGNNLEYLPQTFANLKNLKELNLYDNNLLYLPGSMADLSMDIDVDANPFNLEDDSDDFIRNSEVPSLTEYSAEVIMKSGLNGANVLPKVLLRYVEYGENYCSICGRPCFIYYGMRFVKYFECDEIVGVEMKGTSNIENANFECYACSSNCALFLTYYWEQR